MKDRYKMRNEPPREVVQVVHEIDADKMTDVTDIATVSTTTPVHRSSDGKL